MLVSKEHIRHIIYKNSISCMVDAYSLFRNSFTDILQKLVEVELDASLECEKIKREIWKIPTNAMIVHQNSA